MSDVRSVKTFLEKFSQWVRTQSEIEAAALVGSYARDAANEESDVDLIIITKQPARYIDDPSWLSVFGEVADSRVENWGNVTSLRVSYAEQLEVEYSFALPEWAHIPVDPGTSRVIGAGTKILFDARGALKRLHQEVSATLRPGER